LVNKFGSDPNFQILLSTGKIPAAALVTPTPVTGTPVAGTPVAPSPVTGTPVAGTPVGETPVAGTPVATPLAVPKVNGVGLDTNSFNVLVNSSSANSLLSQLANQNLATIVSQISQTQLNQLVSKFGSDPNFQALLATGTIPSSLLNVAPPATNKALLASVLVNQEEVILQFNDIQLVGVTVHISQ